MGRKLSAILATVVVFLLIVVLAGVIFIYSGAYNVAANDSHYGLVRWILLTTTEQSIAKQADELGAVELPSDSTALWRGFRAFEDMCVECHGSPSAERGWIGRGVKPAPPYLHEEAEGMSDAELFWVIRHGIKFTAMPALQPTHTDEQIRELAAFVKQLPAMDETEYAAWQRVVREASSATGSTSAPGGEGGGHGHDDGHDHVH